MKSKRVRIAFLLYLTCSLSIIAQDASNVSSSNQLSVSIETGLYAPKTGCNTAQNGCLPEAWTPTREFITGSSVWVKFTVVNHTDQIAIAHYLAGFSPFGMQVNENTFGMEVPRTELGCWVRPISSCLAPKDGMEHHIKGKSLFLEILPGESKDFIAEVNSEYLLAKPGNYTVLASMGQLDMTTRENTFHGMYRDRSIVKRSDEVRANEITFIIK